MLDIRKIMVNLFKNDLKITHADILTFRSMKFERDYLIFFAKIFIFSHKNMSNFSLDLCYKELKSMYDF